MNALSQKRVLYLRDEIAALRHDNDLYRTKKPSTRREAVLEASASESRRYRLSAIKEELLAMGISPRNKALSGKAVFKPATFCTNGLKVTDMAHSHFGN